MTANTVVKVGPPNNVDPDLTDSLYTAFTKINNQFANIANSGVNDVQPGDGISVASNSTSGVYTITNTGVINVQGNGAISVSRANGNVIISSNGGTGTVTSVGATAGTGIQITGNSFITTAGTFNIINTGVTQLVAGNGISLSSTGGNGNGIVTVTATGGGAGGGTVTSVGADSPDNNLVISGDNPVTSTGTIGISMAPAVTIANSLTTNAVVAQRVTGTLTTASQPNITSVGTLASLSVTGAITSGAGISGTTLTGTLTTASQPNITVIGTLNSLDVGGDVSAGANLNITGNTVALGSITAPAFVGSGASLSALNASNITTGTLSQSRLANTTIIINGVTATLGGAVIIPSATGNSLTLGNYLTGGSFDGSLPVTTNVNASVLAEPGKLVARDANGNINVNVMSANNITTGGINGPGGNLTNLNASNITSGSLPNDRIQNSYVTINGVQANLGPVNATIQAASPNSVTFSSGAVANSSGVTYNGSTPVTINYATIGAPSLVGTGASGLWNISISGNANVASTASTVTSPVQSNITTVGTLTDLTVSTVNSVTLKGTGIFSNLVVADLTVSQIISDNDSDPGRPTYEIGKSRGSNAAPTALQVGDTICYNQYYGYTGGGDNWYVPGYSVSAGMINRVTAIPTANNSIPSNVSIFAGNGVGDSGSSAITLDGVTGIFTAPQLATTGTANVGKLALNNSSVTTANTTSTAWVPIVINGVTYKLLLAS
jgi:hypothetical protein